MLSAVVTNEECGCVEETDDDDEGYGGGGSGGGVPEGGYECQVCDPLGDGGTVAVEKERSCERGLDPRSSLPPRSTPRVRLGCLDSRDHDRIMLEWRAERKGDVLSLEVQSSRIYRTAHCQTWWDKKIVFFPDVLAPYPLAGGCSEAREETLSDEAVPLHRLSLLCGRRG